MGKKLSVSRQAKKDRRRLRRPAFDMDLLPLDIDVRFQYCNAGGARKITIAELYYTDSNQTITVGHSICSPSDEYNNGRGNAIALGRAIRTWWEHEQITRRITENVDRAIPQLLNETDRNHKGVVVDEDGRIGRPLPVGAGIAQLASQKGIGVDVEEAHANLGVDRLVMDPHAESRSRQARQTFTRF